MFVFFQLTRTIDRQLKSNFGHYRIQINLPKWKEGKRKVCMKRRGGAEPVFHKMNKNDVKYPELRSGMCRRKTQLELNNIQLPCVEPILQSKLDGPN